MVGADKDSQGQPRTVPAREHKGVPGLAIARDLAFLTFFFFLLFLCVDRE